MVYLPVVQDVYPCFRRFTPRGGKPRIFVRSGRAGSPRTVSQISLGAPARARPAGGRQTGPVLVLPSVVAAACAALLFAVANVVQRHAAAAVPRSSGGAVRLVWRLLRTPRWLLGAGFAAGGLGLQIVALVGGSLVVVQSVIASGLVVALVLEAGRERRRPTWAELGGAVLVTGGVTVLVVFGPSGDGAVGLGQAFGGLLVVAAVGGGSLMAARRHQAGVWTARLLGAAAGTCFALDALFLKELAEAFGLHETMVVFLGVLGFALASAMGNLTLHRGYQLAPLRVVLPTLTGAEPMAAFLLGRLVLHEGLPGGLTGHLAALGGVLAAVTGNAVVALAEVPQSRPDQVEEPEDRCLAA